MNEEVVGLLVRWEQLLEQGQELLAADICPPERVDLLPEVEAGIRDLQQMDKLLRVHAADAEPPLPTVSGYEILHELGRGGMGVVYLAQQVGLRRTVALKMILAGELADADQRSRFRTEAEAIARLQHPNIVQIYEVGEHNGLPFFSLEFCPGGTLEKKLAGGPLPPREVAVLVQTLAQAVHAAHQKDVIHRDLKPANVLLTADDTPKITDFGLAKKSDEPRRTATGKEVLGTPSYMAPEQVARKNKKPGPACDIYALGAILYECLTGRPPFIAATPLETALQVVNDDPVPPRRLQSRIPRDLETICLTCLHKDPARRYPSAKELADDLGRFGRGEPIHARPVGWVERTWLWCGRNPAWAALSVLVMIAGIGLIQWANSVGREREMREEKLARARQAAETQINLALHAGNFDGALRVAEKALEWVAAEPELKSLHESVVDFRDRIKLLVDFYQNVDKTESLANSLTQDNEARESARKSLEALNVFNPKVEWWTILWKKLPFMGLTPDQQERLKEDIYRQILLLAGLHAKAAILNYNQRATYEGHLHKALEAIEPAKRFRNSSHAVAMLEALCNMGLGKPLEVDIQYRQPSDHTDHYLNGIAHLWLARVKEHLPSRAAADYLVNSMSKLGLDAKNPLPTAEQRLSVASGKRPDHFWTRCWLGVVLERQGEFKAAELAFLSCVLSRPKDSIGYRFRGRAILARVPQAGSPQAAEDIQIQGLADLNEAVLMDPQAWSYQERAEGYIRLANHHRDPATRAYLLFKALKDLIQCIKLDPRSFAKREYLNAIKDYSKAFQQYLNAIKDYSKAFQLDPKLAAALWANKLISLRGEKGRAWLPQAEPKAWGQLWADVAALLKWAQKKPVAP